ncbi:MAG: cytochrome c biogenesis protein CcmG/thiol:disulfide interchange protein DsbE [Limisphaerales bacterium]|jgi:cytochrome c biogenesis protein CcmG/thiol:disulfide interchange protein DsbE
MVATMLQKNPKGVRSFDVRLGIFVLLLTLSTTGFSVERGDIAPNFSLPIIANPPASLSRVDSEATFSLLHLENLRGNMVYLDFWQSNCLPCREILPELTSLRNEYSQLEVLAVSTDTDPRHALAFLKSFGTEVPVLSDPGAIVASSYGVVGVPTGFLIDRQGEILAVQQGNEEKALEAVRRSLNILRQRDFEITKR